MAFRVRKRFGTFEKRAPGVIGGVKGIFRLQEFSFKFTFYFNFSMT